MLLLTILSSVLILPPAAYVFSQPISHFGIPQIVFYLFAVWLLMIVGTGLLTRAMPKEDTDADGNEAEH